MMNFEETFSSIEKIFTSDKLVRKGRKLIYIAHPMFGNDKGNSWDENIQTIRKICDHLTFKIMEENANTLAIDKTPYFFAVQLFLPQFINEKKTPRGKFKQVRETAIDFCMSFVERLDEIWVYTPGGIISDGVKADIERASKCGTTILFKEYPWEEEKK